MTVGKEQVQIREELLVAGVGFSDDALLTTLYTTRLAYSSNSTPSSRISCFSAPLSFSMIFFTHIGCFTTS